jgi:hypothetical protein
MSHLIASGSSGCCPVSPLVLSDRLLALAEDADRAGFIGTAQRLLSLAHSVFDETPKADAH